MFTQESPPRIRQKPPLLRHNANVPSCTIPMPLDFNQSIFLHYLQKITDLSLITGWNNGKQFIQSDAFFRVFTNVVQNISLAFIVCFGDGVLGHVVLLGQALLEVKKFRQKVRLKTREKQQSNFSGNLNEMKIALSILYS